MNSLFTIAPYKTKWGMWVFDDPARGLAAEALIAGIDDMLDIIAKGDDSLVVIFSDRQFPGWTIHLDRVSADENDVGTIYFCPELKIEGWLCPALFKYFPTAPQTIYAQFRAQPQRHT